MGADILDGAASCLVTCAHRYPRSFCLSSCSAPACFRYRAPALKVPMGPWRARRTSRRPSTRTTPTTPVARTTVARSRATRTIPASSPATRTTTVRSRATRAGIRTIPASSPVTRAAARRSRASRPNRPGRRRSPRTPCPPPRSVTAWCGTKRSSATRSTLPAPSPPRVPRARPLVRASSRAAT